MRRFILSTITVLASVSLFAQGYEKSIEANVGIGLDNCQKFTFGLSMINGYRINDYFFIGAGVGYEYLDGLYYHSYEYKGNVVGSSNYDSYDVRNNIQVFARIKANLTNTKVSPFLSGDVGYTVGLSSNEIKMANGLFFQPSFGCDIRLSDKQTIYIMLGYNGQNYNYCWFDNTLGSTEDKMLTKLAGKFAIHVGFIF